MLGIFVSGRIEWRIPEYIGDPIGKKII